MPDTQVVRLPRRMAALPGRQFWLSLAIAVLLLPAALAPAQSLPPQAGTRILDASALHPPAGARVAIVEFSDPQCPACALANPLLKQAAAKYRIPWVRHDMLISAHVWSPAAAVYARWFDQKNKALGDAYRDEVFASQRSIYNPGVLNQFTQKFAQSHGIALPFNVDPQGKLAAEARADTDLSRRTGITHTPTIFVVAAGSKGAPYTEVVNPDRDLYRIIDQALADTRAPMPAPRRGK